MIEPICKNCTHWMGRGKEAFSQLSMCTMPLKTKGIVSQSACGFRTSKDFGCNQFKEIQTHDRTSTKDNRYPIR